MMSTGYKMSEGHKIKSEGIIRQGDPEYPELLDEISNSPEKLYYRGDPALLNTRCIAIVGSRKPTIQGVKTAELIAGRLSEAGITVVSGLAGGIDSAAHRGALQKGGNTIAVIGNGLDVYYPSYNRDLQNDIADAGLVITEYPRIIEVYQNSLFPRE